MHSKGFAIGQRLGYESQILLLKFVGLLNKIIFITAFNILHIDN